LVNTALLLEGPPFSWFDSKERGHFKSYNQFIEELKAQFTPPYHRQTLLNELTTDKMDRYPNLNGYIYSFRKTLFEYGDLPEGIKL
jgi:hypothetical protein